MDDKIMFSPSPDIEWVFRRLADGRRGCNMGILGVVTG